LNKLTCSCKVTYSQSVDCLLQEHHNKELADIKQTVCVVAKSLSQQDIQNGPSKVLSLLFFVF